MSGIVRVEKIVDNGDSARLWDLVILGDGYVAGELPLYEAQVKSVAESMLGQSPFNRLRSFINVHRVDVASDESGAGDLCKGVQRATFFGSNFCYDRIERLLVTADDARVLDAAMGAVPQFNAALVMVNSETYGGSGGAVPVFSTAAGAFEIALHEMGHSHFGLADEYCDLGIAAPSPGELAAPNVTRTLQPLKWQRFTTPGTPIPTTTNANCKRCDDQVNPFADGTVGAFEGAQYAPCGTYRPQYDCRMRTLGVPFCRICEETIVSAFAPFMKRRAAGRR